MKEHEYNTVCEKIIDSTMSYIQTDKMLRFKIDNPVTSPEYGPIYKSAITSSAPITLVYTGAGTGKSSLLKDRINSIKNTGLPGNKILLLNMNISKCKSMASEIPDINIMTFSDFARGIIEANYPELELSDLTSIANQLKLYNNDELTNKFINTLSISNPKDRTTLLTLLINGHLDDIIQRLKYIHKSEYALDAMICQNKMYYFDKNPYDINTILINSVHNMPVPILCTILEYAYKYNCNLFITGSPDETIYDFNMAYNNAMNVLSAYTDKNIDIIRLITTPNMHESIKRLIDMKPNKSLDKQHIQFMEFETNYNQDITNIMQTALNANNSWIRDKLDKNEQILILGLSKADVANLQKTIKDIYLSIYPNLKITNLTTERTNQTSYGTIASKYYNNLITLYPNDITAQEFFYELYNLINNEINLIDAPYTKAQYQHDLSYMQDFMITHNEFKDATIKKPIGEWIQTIINIESKIIQEYNTNDTIIDLSKTNIILSTVHSAVDIRCDNVIVFLKNNSDKINHAICRLALSRANNSELIIFANYGDFEMPYQKYIKMNLQ